ncbi:hypothetical protein G6F22_016854 [Rhizopus arrhizus]|nr:hypothetical protein G6F22_016854 [Rhizopus arrhizus]
MSGTSISIGPLAAAGAAASARAAGAAAAACFGASLASALGASLASALGASAAASAASTSSTTAPSATLSPTFTAMDFTTPPCDAGISIEALSDSTVIRLCSALIVSPTATSTSMTSTSLKSPMSGTLI